MTESQTLSAYFTYCKLQKNLDNKTLKAYQIDLKQFVAFYPKPTTVKRTDMELYIEHLMEHYKASTVKRKLINSTITAFTPDRDLGSAYSQ